MATYADEIAQLRGTRPASFRDLLGNRPFARLMAAQTVSSLGDWVGFTAVLALVYDLGGGFAVSGVMTARMLPSVVFGPVAGALVDRFDRKRMMIVADLSRGGLYASLPFVRNVWAVFAVSFVIESLALVWSPSRDASLPNLVPRRQLANANSLGLATTYGTLPFGGAISAFLVGISGLFPYLREPSHRVFLPLWLDALTFGFSAVMLTGVPIRTPARSDTRGEFQMSRVWHDIVDGVRFLRQNSFAASMTVAIVGAFSAVGAVLGVGQIFMSGTLHASKAGFSILITAFGIGMGLGMASINKVVEYVERDVLLVWSMLAAAATLIVLAAMPNLTAAALVIVFLGVFCGSAWVSGYVLLQENVTDEYRGRTFGSLTVLSRLGLFVSLTAFPLVAAAFGRHQVVVASHRVDLSGTRVAMWIAGLGVIGATEVTRRGLVRFRVSRPKPLALVPKLKRPPARGAFVVFEGVEGAGKGTQMRLAKEWLESQGVDVLVTREPGGTPIGDRLRDLLLSNDTGHLEPRTEALLFAASRAQHVATVIRPALADGKIVLCDRFIDSSLAYQGWARGLGEQDVLTLNVWATQGLFPDLVLLLHLEPEAGLARSLDVRDRIEMESTEFHAKVADAYLRIAEEHPERFVVIDADGAPEKIHERVRAALERVVREREDDRGG